MLDMLTADAVAKHGHEYSRPAPSPTSFLAQMPLSILNSVMRRQEAPSAPPKLEVNKAASLDENGDEFVEQQKSPMGTAPDGTTLSPTPSRPASSSSRASTETKPKKRAPKPKTTFNLAHPPTTGPRQKLHLRPKVLLQLHQVIPSRRPKPAYEVIPFSLLAPRSTRRLARTFNSRERLGPNDLLIVKAEEYENKNADEKSDDERWGARDVIGVVCPGKKDDKGTCMKTEVLMDDGSSWEATSMPNGGYEFICTDEHGLQLKSRWVPKATHARRVSSMSIASQASPSLPVDDKKFNFSTISANSRRHPVIANMTRNSIDIFDSYSMPTATSPPSPSYPSSPLPTPLTPTSITDACSYLDISNERLPVKTDDALRRFIVISGIWVAFAEGWSPAYAWSKNTCPSPLSTSATFRPAPPNRTVSMSFIDSPRSASPASTIDENRRTFPKILRTGSQMLHRNASFSIPSLNTPTKTSPSSTSLKTRSRRSNSLGNNDFNPRTGSTRKKRFGLALEDQTLPETEEERQSKRSIELLRIKELALSDTQCGTPRSPPPVQIVEPPRDETRSPSPASPSSRTFASRSAYEPVTTKGLWDSGVVDGPGLKVRPTSLVVLNEKKEKEKKKKERSKSREKRGKDEMKEKEKDSLRRSERFKQRFINIFRREKT
ncbi:hypothetical protein BDV96DRAFT_41413 [Lophiotrema nucula]|uniref:Uncharacterized protein n=1 Tax=Lophiotrema nucula TaxID=690887 RepID=A0A6A5Z9E0_9PLEO|nr:hypothetical protein BDV96DRAFT_41413 [Lophiotrema nucula]